MYWCENISKYYGENRVLENFSYIFPEKGLVLLYGESGSGKTTLLNILSGVLNFNQGIIHFQAEEHIEYINSASVDMCVAYITQDVHFIDYLTIMDNLRLSCISDEVIEEKLKLFEMIEFKDAFPTTLSGGEKQRIAILQAILSGKHVILLDEPTASLDLENKHRVFQLLNKMKTDVLIVCSSHDIEAHKYADDIIDFNNAHNCLKNGNKYIAMKKNGTNGCKRPLYPFFSKWYKYKGREKKSIIQLTIILVFVFLSVCIADTPQNKLESNIEYTYKLNQFVVSISNGNKESLQELKTALVNTNAKEATLQYNLSVPIIMEEGSIEIKADYNLELETIPFNKDSFLLSDNVKYGSYFTNPSQIMLSSEKASSMGNPETLVGQNMKIILYDKEYSFEIVGIFDDFDKFEKQYLHNSGITTTEEGLVFINGEFTKRYDDDTEFYMYGNRSYAVYYDSYKDMKKAYNDLSSNSNFIVKYADIDSDLLFVFAYFFYILLPSSVIILAISMLFYFQTKRIELLYNKHYLSVYQYLGYPIKSIKKCLIKGNYVEISLVIGKAIIIAFPVMFLINYLNKMFVIIPFRIFTFNPIMIFSSILFALLLSVILSLYTIKKIGDIGWYNILLEQRDLI